MISQVNRMMPSRAERYKETSPVITCPGYGVSCHTTLYRIKSDIETQLNNNVSLI